MEQATAQQTHVGMTWEEVCADPGLNDLPYKIETNEWGQIVMSPTRYLHGYYAAAIGSELKRLLGDSGVLTVETAIETSKGVKVANAAWTSRERYNRIREAFAAPIAPEICAEVISPTNARAEIEMKIRLYLEAGAREVWTCDLQGNVTFCDATGRADRSRLAPEMPSLLPPTE